MRNVAETDCDGLAPTQTLARSVFSVNTETPATYERPAKPRKLTRSFGLQCKQHDRGHKKCTSYEKATQTLDFPRRQLGGSHSLTRPVLWWHAHYAALSGPHTVSKSRKTTLFPPTHTCWRRGIDKATSVPKCVTGDSYIKQRQHTERYMVLPNITFI